MAQAIEEKLLQAIQKDDVNAFNALMEVAQCGKYRLGRFPVLSLMYLYKSRKLIATYEERFIKMSASEELSEPASVVRLFAEKAGKCLRLYYDNAVSPLEMLLILDKINKLKKVYPSTKPSEAVKTRLKTIYFIKHALGIQFEGKNIIIERRPLSPAQRNKIIALATGCFIVAATAIVVPVSVNAYAKNHEGDVTTLSQIDFGAQTTYTLKKNITIPENYSVKEVNCSIKGGGYTLTFEKNASLGEFNGSLSNVKIQTSGDPIFTVCAQSAVLSDVTVNVGADLQTSDNSAFVAVTNYGTFDGVVVNVGGKISAVASSSGDSDETVFGGMVMVNSYSYDKSAKVVYGTIKNCSVHYSNFSITGELTANATFGGIVGVNYGIVQDSTVTGEISANTFDLGGACYVNYRTLSGIVNGANLSQTSNDDGWSPIVGGIVVDNAAIVENCQNSGDLSVTGKDAAICGGIAARTYGQTNYCMSSGDITVTASTAYVGGIFGISQLATNNYYVYIGTTDHCINQGNINASLGEGTSYVGGIGGYVPEALFNQSVYYGGSIINSIFIGGVRGKFNYFGNIVGVCGANIYEKNSYTADDTEYLNFDGNYHIQNSFPSFGATVTTTSSEEGEETEEFNQVSGKGVTVSTETAIKNSKTYKDILEKLNM